MLGLRGIRLGLMIPDLIKMQTRAILNAAIARKQAGGDPHAEIMIPLVGHVNELAASQTVLEAEAKKVEEAAGVEVDYKFGTMIEVPRGALTADEIAKFAAVLQLRHERPDADGIRLQPRRRGGRLPACLRRARDPARQPVPDAGRGGRGAARPDRGRKGRSVRPNLKIGICGEHGGDPASIHFFDEVGLDYVSCSPFRVPVARLAAAQAALSGAAERDK